MKRSNERRRRFARSAELAFAALAALSACAPLRPPPGIPDGPPREPTVRVGLAVDTASVSLGGTTTLELLDGVTRDVIATVSPDQNATVEASQRGDLMIQTPSGESRGGGMIIARATGAGFIEIDGRPYRGSAVVRANGPARLTVINEVDMENYLLGVVPFEIGRVGPELLEAVKAQAVAARTYAFRYLGRRDSLGFDVFATVSDQVYGGAAGEHEPVTRGVLETAGEILTYRGEPIEAFYHSTCSGRTAAIEEVWPTESPRPYLVSVVDLNPQTGEAFDVTSNRFEWTQRWTAEELREILNRTLADSLPAGATDIGELRDFQILERTESGRIRRMRITTSAGTFDVGGDRIRWIFLTPNGPILNSSMFDIAVERDATNAITAVVAEGGGWGHGIGMCQVGAMGRARAGQDYRTILETYYPGADLVRLY